MQDRVTFSRARKGRAVPKSDPSRARAFVLGAPPGSFGRSDRLNRRPGRAPAEEGLVVAGECERTPHGIGDLSRAGTNLSSDFSPADLIGSCALLALFLLLAMFGDVGAL